VTTFPQARAVVDAAERPRWRADQGTFMVALWGYEDAEAWRVVAGAAEAIQRQDADFVTMDQRAFLVRKADGVLERLVVIEHLERLAAMTPYGPVPENDLYG